MTPEEAREQAWASSQDENTLSSIKLVKNSKGYTWEIKVKELDIYMALEITERINEKLRQKYEKQPVCNTEADI